MKHLRFEKPYFVEDYKEALVKFTEAQSNLVEISKQFEEPENLYMDPDCVTDLEYTPYFNWLTLFLNLRAWECGKPYKFVAPSLAGTKLCSEAKNPKWFLSDAYKYGSDQQKALEQDHSKILVFDEEDKKVLRLTSDQLGFTAFQGDSSKWDDARYPLYRYLRLAEDKNAAAEFISRYVYDTRTLGGAFVWPTDCVNSGGSLYNTKRGVGRRCTDDHIEGYIEDRVDLTLLEVKTFFTKRCFNGPNTNIEGIEEVFLLKYGVNLPSGKNSMKPFLEDIFESFEDYVDFFMLNAFVEDVGKEGSKDYVPKDITTDKPFERNEAGEFVIGKRLSERDLSEGDLKEILGRVQSWTMERTGKMEEKLKDCAVC